MIVGLGNPGEEYRSTRHNIGFLTLDYLARQQDISLDKQRFDASFGKGRIGDEPVLLAKPQTYMNLSGVALEKLFSFFKVNIQDLIVIHDDLDLPFQTVRLKVGGGEGGHKGLISITSHLGSSEFIRVRIGIGKPARKTMVEKYVLSPFSEEEQKVLPKIIKLASEAIQEIVFGGIQSAMRIYHGKPFSELADQIVN